MLKKQEQAIHFVVTKKRKKNFTPKNCDVTSGLKSTEFQIRKQFCTKISDFGHLRMVLDYRC